MKVKLKDVAAAAGVSVSTVSRVLNGDRERPASEATMNKIWSAVSELGYVPNQNAQKLVKGEDEALAGKGKIGVLYTSTSDIKTDPFFSCIGIGIQQELRNHGYEMAFALATYHMDYGNIYNYIMSHPAEGIIITGRFEKEILNLVKQNFKYIIYTGANSVDAGFDEVICDGYSGARTAIAHLLDEGHTRIGYVGYVHDEAVESQLVNEHRYRAYRDLLDQVNIKRHEADVVHTRLYTTSSFEAMSRYLEEVDHKDMPTAFYCANDATAFGVMKALQQYGLRIPEDVAVIGLDDVEMAKFVTPTLSTVSIPRKSLGIQAVKTLIDKIESRRDYPMRIDLPFDLKVRESSHRPNDE